MRIIACLACFLGATSLRAEGLQVDRAAVQTTITRGLAFLAKDAIAWRDAHNCVSCHHAGMVAWALREAKQAGHAVDDEVLAEMTKWIAESGDGKTSLPRPKDVPKAFNAKAVWFALALGAETKPDTASQQGLSRLLKTVKSDQTDSGAWSWWPETRPPIFGHADESVTALASLALLPAAKSGEGEAKAALGKGIDWLAGRSSDDDAQSLALRLVLWSRLDRPADETDTLVRRITSRQNSDGGWSQAKELPSDAWATGQSLYALGIAGFKSSTVAVARGQSFLAKTQRDDGSWPMTSRPIKPGGDGSKSLIPITGAGSAWGVLGLVRTR
jgi:N-acyl-D-amino-acid deacylase